MKKVFANALVMSLVVLAGCATAEEAEAYRRSHAANAEKDALTGSRLIKPTTERMVGAVGNKEYNELNLHKGIANSVSAPGR